MIDEICIIVTSDITNKSELCQVLNLYIRKGVEIISIHEKKVCLTTQQMLYNSMTNINTTYDLFRKNLLPMVTVIIGKFDYNNVAEFCEIGSALIPETPQESNVWKKSLGV